MLVNVNRIRTLVFLLCAAVVPSTSAMSQDIGDIINQLVGGNEDSEPAKPQSPIDVLDSDSAATKLQLNNDQRDKIKTIIGDFRTQSAEIKKSYDDRLKAITPVGEKLRKRAQFRSEVRSKTEELKTKTEASLLELLNEQQQTTLKTLVPESKTERPESDNTKDNSSSKTTSNSGRSTSSTGTPAPARRTENTVASFGSSADATSTTTTAAGSDSADTTAPSANSATDNNAILEFNFQEAPWTDVLKLFAKAADLTLNIRDVPSGSFTYYDREKYTPAQALDIMNRMLMQNGFILVRHDRFLSVFDANKGVPPNLVETVAADELSKRGETELLRVALPLGDRDAAKASEEVRALLGPQGKVAPLESANSIVVTDIAANLIRVQKLLQPPPKLGDDKLTFKAFPLTKIDAAEAADIVRSLLGVQTGVTNVSASQQSNSSRSSRSSRGGFDPRQFFSRMRGGSSGGSTQSNSTNKSTTQPTTNTSTSKVAVDYRTNSILVNATAASMKLVEQMIEAIDVDPSNVDTLANGRSAKEPYLEVYRLNTTDATEVAKTLNVLHPGTVVNEDGKNKLLHIMANAEQHREISAHIRQLDGVAAGDTFAVLPLRGLSGYDVSTTVAALYKSQPQQAPSVQMDPSGRNLIVRGDAGQIRMVQSMIDRLAEEGPYESSGRTVRIVGSGAASTAFMQQTLGSVYPQVTFTPAPQATNNNDSSTSRNSRSNRNSRSSGGDDERSRRIMEFRERFFGGGGSGRGNSSSGSNARPEGSSRSSSGRGSSGRGR